MARRQREKLHTAGDEQCFRTDQDASARIFTIMAKAVSMPLFVLAVTISTFRPIDEAAICNSETKIS
jgi:hypothetical protein